MGRVTNQTAAAPPPSTPMKHFSHPHDLHPIPSNNLQNPAGLCSACKLQSRGTMYTCPPCNFLLHQSCAKLPSLITHPAHGGCNLSLLTISSYPGGRFSCDACSRFGDGWSYHCSRCDYDLHVLCSTKPLEIRHLAHPCDLKLAFQNPYTDSNEFSCDICRKIGKKQWLYRCNSCQFDVHLDCSSSQAQQQQQHHLQHQCSLPNSSHNHIPLLHSASTGGIHNHYPVQSPLNPAGRLNGYVPPNQYLTQNNPLQMGGGFGSNLLTNMVEGVMQQIGQTAVQEVISLNDGSSY